MPIYQTFVRLFGRIRPDTGLRSEKHGLSLCTLGPRDAGVGGLCARCILPERHNNECVRLVVLEDDNYDFELRRAHNDLYDTDRNSHGAGGI